MPQMIPEHLVRNIQPNLHNYQGGNLSYQYQPPSPQAQYQPGGSAQPQFASQYGQFEPMQQQPQGAAQQRPWADVIADVMREQFGLNPKETGSLYRQPYPEWFERVPLPNRFKVPDFSKFSGQDGVSTYEHISRFLAQCGEASAIDALKVRLFRLSLSGSAFTWFSSLPYGSINSWADLEKQFHSYFYSEGMIPPIREKFSSEDFDSLSHLIQKKVNHVCPYMYGSDDEEDDSEIAAAEWVRSKKVIPCQWVKSPGKEEKYDFDITKADKIFDLLLQEKQIQLPAGHTIPSPEELGKKGYCKWHYSGSHSTNDCKVFRQQIQVAIEGGKIRFDDSKKLTKVDTDEAKRLAKGKSVVAAPINMVFTLPAEFGIDQADVDEVEEESAKLVLSPERAVFDKHEGTENRHLKPLYINGYVNGKPMSKMMVDGGVAVNLMPYATFRKLGRNAEDLIKTNMVLKDFGGNPSETKGVLNVELTVGSKTIPTTFFVIDGKGSYSLLLGRD
uniref:Retrotransposon protein, putative, unclassified n=1 Tax=Oryza sativa subsp. japonica TaxID=39947 RepID=Q2QSA0_ORYSJ|nr:retrotransposon protein, putative, unclassified [Oryza sativa Japonica Group]